MAWPDSAATGLVTAQRTVWQDDRVEGCPRLVLRERYLYRTDPENKACCHNTDWTGDRSPRQERAKTGPQEEGMIQD